jgi:hypothetical protein
VGFGVTLSSSGLGWVVGHVARHPLAWLWIAVSTASWPLIVLLAPRGLTGGPALQTGLIYEVAFIGLLLGTLVGGALLERGAWFLAGVHPFRRLGLELSALFATSVVLTLPGLIPPLFLGRGAELDLEDFVLRAGLSHLHLSSLVLVLLRVPVGTPVRVAALIAATWVLPAIANPATFAGRFVTTSLDAGQYLIPAIGSVLADLAWKEALAPIMGMLGAALLLRPPTLIHALRNSR